MLHQTVSRARGAHVKLSVVTQITDVTMETIETFGMGDDFSSHKNRRFFLSIAICSRKGKKETVNRYEIFRLALPKDNDFALKGWMFRKNEGEAEYSVFLLPDGRLSCECLGFEHHGKCAHTSVIKGLASQMSGVKTREKNQ